MKFMRMMNARTSILIIIEFLEIWGIKMDGISYNIFNLDYDIIYN